MWKLTEIKISNIVSFHEASLTINQNVATLIFGRNEDNASQPCNGSGKSSLIEAISFALTGEQLRKVKSIDEIINDSSEDAYVYVRLENDYDDTSFTIERTISRNNPQSIECHKYDASGQEIETDKTIQPTVSDYNKFILSEIGLTKDDIYNNFILCDNKYESFFDCSDKNKKEIINRFSNGELIDAGIERVQADMLPISEKLTEVNSQVTRIKGSISAIEKELEHVDEKIAGAKQDREQRIQRLNGQIKQTITDIFAAKEKKDKGNARLRQLERLQSEVEDMEDSDLSFIEAYQKIKSLCVEYDLGTISDFEELSLSYKTALTQEQQMLITVKEQIKEAESALAKCKLDYEKAEQQYKQRLYDESKLTESDNALKAKIRQEIAKIDEQLDKIEASIKANKNRQAELETLIAHNNALLNGVIVCPKCQHQFFLNDKSSVDDVRAALMALQNEQSSKKDEVESLNQQFDEIDADAEAKSNQFDEIDKQAKVRNAELEKEYASVKALSRTIDEADDKVRTHQRMQSSVESEIERISGKIDVLRNRLFGEITGILDGRILNGKNFIEQQDSSVLFLDGQLKQYYQTKDELLKAPEADFTSSLKASLVKYQSELTDAEQDADFIQSQYDELKGQEVNFTLFKSHIARKKIDALSLIVNDFLEKIGSDIRLKLEGFTVTKTGKLRDKISVQVMRDGIDCGSYHKFSGGEKARLNLACILSLHTLTNSNCEDGKGLDFIIIDELLDKSDEVGMATYCEALNKLNQTALLITQGGVSEGYPHKLLIVKKHGVSTISE